MSAICGIIDLSNNEVLSEVSLKMMNKLRVYSFDYTKIFNEKQVFLGFGMQYVTNESKNEILPKENVDKRFILTADAIIDNRKELFNLLNVSPELRNATTDSELIMMCYEKWGHEAPSYIVGDFAFAIWDRENKELFCARDSVGTRTFYYYISKKTFAFCTVMKPLFAAIGNNVELNERWITDFLALNGVVSETDCVETIYKDIFQLPPGFSLLLNASGIEKKQYWDPIRDVKPLILASDKEYDEAFKKVFSEAVECRLRSSGEIGIMLSGGLDSGSVACVAADILSKERKSLKAFSSIPFEGYKDALPGYCIADESEFINEIKKKFDNLEVTYCRSEGRNSVTGIEEFISMLEQPYKIIENLFWIDEILKKSSNDGCKVLLNGQYGNCTISYGKFFTHTLTLFRKHEFRTLAREIRRFSRLHQASMFRVSKDVIKTTVPFKLRKTISKVKLKKYDGFLKVAINPDLIKKWNVLKRFDEKNFNQNVQRFCDLDEMRKLIINPSAFSHIGAIDTKISLTYGVLRRDPTKDKRVIEFCLSLPSNQFVRNGNERYLIRRAMNGILPDKIRLNSMSRGLQSADKVQRLLPKWEETYKQIEKCLDDANLTPYIDIEKLKRELPNIKEISDKSDWNTIRMFVITLIFSYFLKDFKEIVNN